ncbi:uncharacterized protein LOC144444875 [Glandiceps talaboti]
MKLYITLLYPGIILNILKLLKFRAVLENIVYIPHITNGARESQLKSTRHDEPDVSLTTGNGQSRNTEKTQMPYKYKVALIITAIVVLGQITTALLIHFRLETKQQSGVRPTPYNAQVDASEHGIVTRNYNYIPVQREQELVNVAAFKPIAQSGKVGWLPLGGAVDDNTNGNAHQKSCSMTNGVQNAWWRVDLGQVHAVHHIIIYNRQDCCGERLLNAEVRVGNDSHILNTNTQCGRMVTNNMYKEMPIIFYCDIPTYGRYVSVQLKNRKDFLTLCEVQVMAPVTHHALINVAINRQASQSSSWINNDPNRALDGNNNGIWDGGSCSHTKNDRNAWWKVDLGTSYDVQQVIITNRQDCCRERILNAEVRVGNKSTDFASNMLCGTPVDSTQTRIGTIVMDCDTATIGHVVSVQLKDRTDYLTLCEVQVLVQASSNQKDATALHLGNVALGKSASQSSNWQGSYPYRVIDGNTNGNWSENSCTQTNNDTDPWWKVDLGQTFPVYQVIVTNRHDCCKDRLLSAEVRVGNNDRIGENTLCGEPVDDDQNSFRQDTLFFDCNGPLRGRYVSVQLKNRRDHMTICEVEVLAPSYDALVNLAEGKFPTQSSTYLGSNPYRAIDGNTDTDHSRCTRTNKEVDPWWKVDLGFEQQVKEVILTSEYYTMLPDYQVRVGNQADDITSNTVCDLDTVYDETVKFVCASDVIGQYVSVQVKGQDNALQLCEVEVLVSVSSVKVNLALAKLAFQSSLYGDGYPARAVDGNHDNRISGESCIRTENEIGPWWMVDLGSDHNVDKIVVTNREDCCTDNINGLVAMVGPNQNINKNIQCGKEFVWDKINNSTIEFECATPIIGRFVGITFENKTNFLNFCEVYVYGL